MRLSLFPIRPTEIPILVKGRVLALSKWYQVVVLPVVVVVAKEMAPVSQ